MKIFGTKIPGKEYIQRHGAYGLMYKEGKIATISFTQGFFLPGGGVDAGETYEQALKREAIEELGWEINDLRLIGEATQFFYTAFQDLYIENIGHFYFVGRISDTGQKTEVGHDLVWLTPEVAIEKLYHEHQRWAVLQAG